MEPEPNKAMEELLKASAEARRAGFGADPQMPNPMRARLQDEIARQNRKDMRKAARGFAFWFPRLAIGAAAAALVIGAPVLLLRRPAPAMKDFVAVSQNKAAADNPLRSLDAGAERSIERPALAAGQPVPAMTPLQSSSVVAATASAPTEAAERDAEASMEPGKQTEDAIAARTAKAKVASGGLKQFADVKISPAPELQAGANANAAPRVFKGAVAPAAPASAALAKNQQTNFRQLAQNAENKGARFNSQLQRAASVLNNFQVEQNGTQIRIVDEDGSTYTGKIEQIRQSDSRSLSNSQGQSSRNYAAGTPAPAQRAAGSRADEQAGGTEFYFNASGYNDRLHKRLVFEGNYIIPRGQENANEAARPEQKKEETPARIVGTAKISGESPIEVDAVAVSVTQ